MPERTWKIPEHRIILNHERGLPEAEANAQAADQLAEIVGFAQLHAPDGALEYGVEVVYKQPDMDYETPSAIAEFDAVLVDVVNGAVISTYPPYASIDPGWEAKR